MKRATLISVAVTTVFYMLCGCMGYAAFGDMAPGNLLTGFGFYNPYWLLDIAIVVHLVGAYQVYCQPLFAFVEKWALETWPRSQFIGKEIQVPQPARRSYKLNFFRLIWRTTFVVISTVVSMLLPFFNDVVGLLGAIGFWPLTVYFPVELYIVQKKVARGSTRWVCLQLLSLACLAITIASAAGSIAGVVSPAAGAAVVQAQLMQVIWRTTFVVESTVVSMLLPFFNDVVGLLGAIGFWPLTVYFPVELYIVQKKVARGSTRWVCLQLLSLACLAITIASAAGSIAGVVSDLKVYRPFKAS
ncbi:hypothetical protein C4D60_Mb01t09620 [Musa balbisiana]|uniref:Amino acid transporter transmembrane domain-containing protein n=1 Tax=Musa balbisiana TaxID=52838 RepID=A0A4S8JL15_MUSBA|nr:hypothetical protein C4D60_Mb01t09620 [Musa balbisiana]